MHNVNEEYEATNLMVVSKLEAEGEKHGARAIDWKAFLDLLLTLFNCGGGNESLDKLIDKYPSRFSNLVTRAMRWTNPRATRDEVEAVKATLKAVAKKAKSEEQAAFVAAAG